MSLEKSGSHLERLKEMENGLISIDVAQKMSLAYQRIVDWLRSVDNDIDRKIQDSAEELAVFNCNECCGHGWYEYEDRDDYVAFTIVEICECVIGQVDV